MQGADGGRRIDATVSMDAGADADRPASDMGQLVDSAPLDSARPDLSPPPTDGRPQDASPPDMSTPPFDAEPAVDVAPLDGAVVDAARPLADAVPVPDAAPSIDMAPQPRCDDEIRNGEESDLDCGGPCAPCADGALCGDAIECVSGRCEQGVCAAARCGDGVINADEACDAGDAVDETCAYGLRACRVCNENCQEIAGVVRFCGDAVVDPEEVCDDGNLDDDDGCSLDCATARCPPGFHGDGLVCDDIDECLQDNGGCAQTCRNSDGAHVCECAPGWVLAADGLGCDDIDECRQNNGGCGQACINVAGGHHCACGPGFALEADGTTCGGVEVCDDTVHALLDRPRIDGPRRDSDAYQPPDGAAIDALTASFRSALEGGLADAAAHATQGGYVLCRGPEEATPMLVWYPLNVGQGQARILWRYTDATPLILGTPHNAADGTRRAAIQVLDAVRPRVFVSAGTHRCANAAQTDCSGTSGVCADAPQPYSNADMAHVTESIYQAAHAVFAEAYPADWVMSFHGMSRDGASVSDGTLTSADPAASLPPLAASRLIGEALARHFPDALVTSCNHYPGAQYARRLCGTTNTQGRLVNGVADACGQSTRNASHRFIHLEQSRALRDDGEGVAAAIREALDAEAACGAGPGCARQATCHPVDAAWTCVCNPGWLGDGTQCVDIDECADDNGGCGHLCINLPGSVACDCNDGWVLAADGLTCEVEQICGDGRQGPDEQCDDGEDNTDHCPYGAPPCQVCTAECMLAVGVPHACGDGVLDAGDGEACDGEDRCTATCELAPEPTLRLDVIDGQAHEGGTETARIRLTLSTPYPMDRTVFFTLGGSAELEADYTLSVNAEEVTSRLVFPAGETEIDLVLTPVLTPTVERHEWARLTLLGAPDLTVAPDAATARISIVEYGPSPGAVYYVGPDGDDAHPGSEAEPFASLAHALDQMEAGDTVYLFDGVYRNRNFTLNHGEDGTRQVNNGPLARIAHAGAPDRWTTIAAYPDGNDTRPVLQFDGAGGLQIDGHASYVVIDGLEIYGPNEHIHETWAHAHRWTKPNYYAGRGIYTWGPVHHIVIRNCDIHHTPNSGIRFNGADYILVENNTVSNATWWSSSAESGIVIATAAHIDEADVVKILYSGNTVYNNWNFMEFCSGEGGPVGNQEGSEEDVYGNCDVYTGGIIDGQGLYVTLNNQTYLHGRMRFENNIAFNNGFGGVVYHKTDRGELVNNLVFMNGAYPGRSNYTGLTVNTVDDLLIQNNLVWARDDDDYGIKNNGNARNVVARGNFLVGRSQFGDAADNIFLAFDDAPALATVFENGVSIAHIRPDPHADEGPTSAAEIDQVIDAVGLDFRLRPTAEGILDGGVHMDAAPTDAWGVTRPQWTGVDIGAHERAVCTTPSAGLNDPVLTGTARRQGEGEYQLTANGLNERGAVCALLARTALDPTRLDVTFEFDVGVRNTGGTGLSYTLLDADAAAGCDAYPTASLADSPLGLTVEIDPWGVVEEGGDPTADDHLELRTADELIAWAAVPDLDPHRWHALHIRIDALRIRITLDGALVMDTVLPSADLLPARAGQLFQAFTGDLPNVHGIRAVRMRACADGLPWDNCPDVDTPDQLDSDYDGLGDACDPE